MGWDPATPELDVQLPAFGVKLWEDGSAALLGIIQLWEHFAAATSPPRSNCSLSSVLRFASLSGTVRALHPGSLSLTAFYWEEFFIYFVTAFTAAERQPSPWD